MVLSGTEPQTSSVGEENRPRTLDIKVSEKKRGSKSESVMIWGIIVVLCFDWSSNGPDQSQSLGYCQGEDERNQNKNNTDELWKQSRPHEHLSRTKRPH